MAVPANGENLEKNFIETSRLIFLAAAVAGKPLCTYEQANKHPC